MDYRKMYSDYVREQIAESANPYPTGVQGFRGGVEAERARIIALLEDYRESITVQSASSAGGSLAIKNAIALIKGESE